MSPTSSIVINIFSNSKKLVTRVYYETIGSTTGSRMFVIRWEGGEVILKQ